jgi:DNA ligase-1
MLFMLKVNVIFGFLLLIIFTMIGSSRSNAISKPKIQHASPYKVTDGISQYWVSEKLDGIRGYWNGKR